MIVSTDINKNSMASVSDVAVIAVKHGCIIVSIACGCSSSGSSGCSSCRC